MNSEREANIYLCVTFLVAEYVNFLKRFAALVTSLACVKMVIVESKIVQIFGLPQNYLPPSSLLYNKYFSRG